MRNPHPILPWATGTPHEATNGDGGPNVWGCGFAPGPSKLEMHLPDLILDIDNMDPYGASKKYNTIGKLSNELHGYWASLYQFDPIS